MADISGIDIAFSFNGILLFAGLVVFALLSFFVYKYTVPQTSLPVKIFMGLLRTLVLLIILIAIFEPVISITKREKITPVNLVAVDNSASVAFADSVLAAGALPEYLSSLGSGIPEVKFISFGDSVKEMASGQTPDYSESSTNMENIFDFVTQENLNVASLTIVSDGIINEGSTPLYSAEKAGYPVFTVGVGDTTVKKDISVGTILFNEITYVDNESPIVASIRSSGFAGKKVTVNLHAGNSRIASQNIELSASGLNKVTFNYTPDESGVKRMYVDVSVLEEENSENNRKIFFTDVRDNKLRILMVSGSPSSDFAFIRQVLERNENFNLTLSAKISDDKFIGSKSPTKQLDSTDIAIFVGYPAKETKAEEVVKVVAKLKENKIPFLFSAGPGTDFNKLRLMEEILPVTIKSYRPGFTDVQPDIVNPGSPLLGTNVGNNLEQWSNMPTVAKSNSLYSLKAGAEIISKVKIRGIPDEQILISTLSLPGRRSIFVSAANIWRWKLLRTKEEAGVFDSFVNNSVKWLNIPDDKKQVVIKTGKRVYPAGEKVEFNAQIYDDAFNPLENAVVEVEIKNGKDKISATLASGGGGLYSGEVNIPVAGYYNYSGRALKDGKNLGEDSGSFSIGEVNPERENLVLNKVMLERMASISGGKYYNFNDANNLISDLGNESDEEEYSSSISELKLWSEEWLLYVIVILFSIEWFLRKRMGML